MLILDVYSNVLSARFKNKRGMLCIHVLIIGLNKIPIAIYSNPLWNVDCIYDFCARSVYISEICPLLA